MKKSSTQSILGFASRIQSSVDDRRSMTSDEVEELKNLVLSELAVEIRKTRFTEDKLVTTASGKIGQSNNPIIIGSHDSLKGLILAVLTVVKGEQSTADKQNTFKAGILAHLRSNLTKTLAIYHYKANAVRPSDVTIGKFLECNGSQTKKVILETLDHVIHETASRHDVIVSRLQTKEFYSWNINSFPVVYSANLPVIQAVRTPLQPLSVINASNNSLASQSSLSGTQTPELEVPNIDNSADASQTEATSSRQKRPRTWADILSMPPKKPDDKEKGGIA